MKYVLFFTGAWHHKNYSFLFYTQKNSLNLFNLHVFLKTFVIPQEFDTHKTFGLFSVCDVKVNKKTEYKIRTCKLFYSISYMPGYWVACCFFIGFSLLLITLVGVLGFASVCYRRVRGCSKSIFAVAGLMQAIAGLFWWIIFVFA